MAMTELKGLVKGQRIINESDPQMGLGIVDSVQNNCLIKVFFPAKAETYTYRLSSAPLRRIVLREGQAAASRGGEHFRISRVEEKDGLVFYYNEDGSIALPEYDLEDKVPLASSLGRMRYSNVGYAEDLDLRLEAHAARSKMYSSASYFFGASRITVLPHQLYTVQRVTSMLNPRVLLADEVGLGKTIEAGMIFSALRAGGRASRVLIVLPDSLANQWLAEMARRFNELFRPIGREYLEEEENPYADARRAITPWTALKEGLLEDACQFKWDLLIVDEAHHLREGEEAYEAVSRLAQLSRSVLLLTATPSRGGVETEFGLLRILDPQRFSDFEKYCTEREFWQCSSSFAKVLCGYKNNAPDKISEALDGLSGLYSEDEQIQRLTAECRGLLSEADSEKCEKAFEDLLNAMIDRHGPGRVIFRNRRARLSGLFCGRRINAVALSRKIAENNYEAFRELTDIQSKQDPRVLWIASYILTHPGEKIVLIANRMQLVALLHERLRDVFGIYSAVFHEGMSVFDRDKQAAWFNDPEGADILLCSEIGSEGRNFQSAHTLIFWDIPLPPDVVEQRIGRLDRIGQTRPVDVYVLCFAGGKEERLFRWHKAVGSFDGPVVGGDDIINDVDLLENLGSDNFDEIIKKSLRFARAYRREAEANVDYLVDINSFDEIKGGRLRDMVLKEDVNIGLESIVIKLLERFGVNVEEQSVPHLYRITPSKGQQIESLTRIREDGTLVTFDRSFALAREEVEYLSGAHPMVKELFSYMLDGAEGSASAVTWRNAPGSGVIVQFLFIFEALGADYLEIDRYLTPLPIKMNVLMSGRTYKIYKDSIPDSSELKRIKPASVASLWEQYGERVESLSEKITNKVNSLVVSERIRALERVKRQLENEIARLTELQKINPAISDAEILAQRKRCEEICEAVKNAAPRLDAVRLIVLEKK